MSFSLRPVLRTSPSPTLPKTTYICSSCRNARLLRRPKRPYTFSQLVTLSDGSAFMLRTTSPQPVYRSTRDTRNAPLWNPSSKELMNVEDDEAGRLAGFRARFGTQFDALREVELELEAAESESQPARASTSTRKAEKDSAQDEWAYEFEEDDSNLLDLISSYGQQPGQSNDPAKDKKGKK